MSDDVLLDEARKAVRDNDLAAWERVRAIMIRRGAVQDEAVAIEHAKFAERFLKDLEHVRSSILSSTQTADADRIHGQPVADEADLIESLLEAQERQLASGGSYIRVVDVALALNRTFGITGWSLKIDTLRFIEQPFRVNSAGRSSSDGQYWMASVLAVVTLTVKGPGRRVADRQDAGIGLPVGGKGISRHEAVAHAIKSSIVAALKNAARFLGPATGLTLMLDERRDLVERLRNDAKNIKFKG